MLVFPASKKNRNYYKLTKFLSIFYKSKLIVRNYLKRDDYEKYVLTQNIKKQAFLQTLNNLSSLNNIQTQTAIQPALLGRSMREVIKENGKPTLVLREGGISVFIYRWRYKLLKNKCIITFYKNQVFLITFCYQSSELNYKHNIIKLINQKYLDPELFYPEILNHKITDNNNNIIFMDEDAFGLKINYLFDKDSYWFNLMIQELYNQKENLNANLRLKEKLFYDKI